MVKRALPSLTALRSFEAASRHHSFRRAAEELGITQSAISHQVAALEEALKVTLFRRVSRGIELTEAGAQFYPYLRDGFDRIAQGASLVSRAELGGDLTVQVYVTVAVRWLVPRIHLFQARHPGILVRFHTRDFHWEFDPAFADIGMISTTKPDNPDLAYTHLFDATLIPVCTPGIAQAGMGMRQPADLVNHALLQVYTAVEDWHVWLDAAARFRRRRGQRPRQREELPRRAGSLRDGADAGLANPDARTRLVGHAEEGVHPACEGGAAGGALGASVQHQLLKAKYVRQRAVSQGILDRSLGRR